MKLMFLFFTFLSGFVLWAQTPPEPYAAPPPPGPSEPAVPPPPAATSIPVTIPSSIPVNMDIPADQTPGVSIENQATAVPLDPNKDKFFYDPTIGRDPFKIPMINVGPLNRAEPVINEDSLEGASIPEGVRVLAIIYDSKKPRALVEKLSNKKSYLVFTKSRLGIGGGVVSEIREDEIIVVRSVETEGQTNVEHIVLRLNDKKRKNDTKSGQN